MDGRCLVWKTKASWLQPNTYHFVYRNTREVSIKYCNFTIDKTVNYLNTVLQYKTYNYNKNSITIIIVPSFASQHDRLANTS